MSKQTMVIKDGGHRKTELFSEEKLMKSIEASCKSVRMASGAAKDIAKHTAHTVTLWTTSKTEVTSTDLRRKTTEVLTKLCPEAGYLYQHHKTML